MNNKSGYIDFTNKNATAFFCGWHEGKTQVRTSVNTRVNWIILSVIILGITACGGSGNKNDPSPQGSYEILKSSSASDSVHEFYAQDLLAAREDPTGILKLAYEGAMARFTEKNGREPQDDLETAAAICDWVAFHLRHPYFYTTYLNQTPDPRYNDFKWDPVKIIAYSLGFDPADVQNWPSPYCTQQNFAAAGIMNYAGLHGRLVYVQGHDGLEYYSWKYRKWIWCDSTFNEHFVLPLKDGTVQPLGARELQELTLQNGIQKVQTVKHGYPDASNPAYNYLGVYPHGFRRYAPFLYMQTLNGMGSEVNNKSIYINSSCVPIPDTYIPAVGEFVQSENDPKSIFSSLPCVTDPRILDIPLDTLTLGVTAPPLTNEMVINLRTTLPYAVRFEIQYGSGSPWQTLESVPLLKTTATTSASIKLPWKNGVVNFRAIDALDNTSELVIILLK